MLKAILMDFNGVILDDEPFHLELYQRILLSYRISLTKESYYQKYLVLNDEECFRQIFNDQKNPIGKRQLSSCVQKKRRLYQKEIGDRLIFFPGVVHFIQRASRCYKMAIVSGARRSEITTALEHIQILQHFKVIVSADDVTYGKPNPEGLYLACTQLNEQPEHCLVIEDAVGGIEMAHHAGMKCIAITNSYPAKKLKKADLVIESFQPLPFSQIERLFL